MINPRNYQSEELFAPNQFPIDQDFWQNRRVFITGHTGFKGSWLAVWLHKLGAIVRGYSLVPEHNPNLFRSLKLETWCDHVIGDIRNIKFLKESLLEFDPEIVFHLAAQSLVREGYRSPIDTFEVNVIGTANLFEACRESKTVRVVINVTTDKVYRDQISAKGFNEEYPLGAADPYSTSKACSELVTQSYVKSFFNGGRSHNDGLTVATARAGNVIGGGDFNRDRIIPDAVKAFFNSSPLVIRMPNAIRPWQHVLEPLAGYLMLARACMEEGEKFGCPWNFGPMQNNLVPVSELADLISSIWSEGAKWEIADTDPVMREMAVLSLDSSLARRKLGWQPKLSLKETLELTVSWYKSFFAPEDSTVLRNMMIDQINSVDATPCNMVPNNVIK